jgi:LytS/YehU family sensor histidine kinase
MALRGGTVLETRLARELALVERYVEVMQFRFAGALRLSVDADRALGDALVPPLLLQPLVENAIIHGFADAPGEIRVAAERRSDMLHCTVEDNGRGLAGPVVEGVGLTTARGRLRTLYGDRHRFELGASEAGGVRVSLALPYRVGAETLAAAGGWP